MSEKKIKRVVWKEDAVLNVQLSPQLFTLAQMRKNHLMQFFDVFNENGLWINTDLNRIDPLFCIFVAEQKLRPLLVEKLEENDVKPNQRPVPTKMISYRFSGDGHSQADLINLDDSYSSVEGVVLQKGLHIINDLETIYNHEYVGMVGDPEKLRKRLIRCFETGVNWDDSKEFIFKGIKLPSAKK